MYNVVVGVQDGTKAPWGIRIFGEPGFGIVLVEEPDRYPDAYNMKARAAALFPEAKVEFMTHGSSGVGGGSYTNPNI